ncbi:hypothetical protein SPRG_19042 [Saprolegnia parasitica CBS 223.65]|uniref:Uncharacterized protein n=1 Tax=Saprolegnia parasitica (strain CBS 223.65) TaxID=695850 RepID=A0A067CY95_SAPPC|nr:hypothetical protein SPRG_19042 [Saprolegnia parasitica CBS 223.65]KDO34200.1 hypothetical protein SPRG_19042 [Saprolegnia parasitica CBS 223.65]|eukprot:XP_012195240.1 hypothetical protein SPRG_19042 [Saprolegnia parasitica CBS 223.65]
MKRKGRSNADDTAPFMSLRQTTAITAIALLPIGLCIGSVDNAISIWDLATFRPTHHLRGHGRSITCLCGVPSTSLLLSAAVDRTLRVWDGNRDFACVQVLTGYNGHILSMTSTNDTLFMACQDTTVKVASVCASSLSAILAPTTEWQSMSNHHGFVYGIRYIAPEARAHGKKPLLFTCSSDNSIVCWDVADMSVLASLHGHRGSVLDLVSVGNQLFSASQDKTICCWDMDTMRCNGILKGHSAAVLTVCSLEDKNRICSGSADETVRIWNTQSLACVHTLHGHRGGVSSILSTEMFVFSASEDSTVKVWDIDFISNTNNNNANTNANTESQGPPRPQKLKMDSSLMSVSAMYNKQTSDASMIHLLRKFVSIPSVSVDPHLVDDCWMAAKFVKGLLRQLGAECRLVHCGPNINPIVIGKLGNDPTKPTVLICGHYDVQAADSNPFMLTGQDGYLYGSGGCLADGAALPNVIFLLHGDHELRGFHDAIADQKSTLGPVDVIWILENTWRDDATPSVAHAMPGRLDVAISVDGPSMDCHGGFHGGAVREPMLDLVALVHRLVDPTSGRFTDQAFYDVAAPDAFVAPAPRLTSLLASLDNASVLARSATTTLTLHTVPNQEPKTTAELVLQHVRTMYKTLPTSNCLRLAVTANVPWWREDPTMVHLEAARRTLETVWGAPPSLQHTTSASKITTVLKAAFEAPCVHLGVGPSHATAERVAMSNLLRARDVFKRLLSWLAERSSALPSLTAKALAPRAPLDTGATWHPPSAGYEIKIA